MARPLDELTRPGPHEVLRGDLALVGLPGTVFTPRSGKNLPAVAFAHGWLQPVLRYRGLLRHLASWGIVVAAPSTQGGPFASSRLLAGDLRTALDICLGVRLGLGEISVHPEKLGVAGHSTGGGCAVLAAASDDRVRAVATLAASETRPYASTAARDCAMPSLHLAGARDLVAPPVAHAELIAGAWQGPSRLLLLPKSDHLAFTEGKHWSGLLVQGKGDNTARKLAKSLLTAFFLHHLTGNKKYGELLDKPIKGVLDTAA